MWLIIAKIPTDTTHTSLKKFVTKGMNGKWFFLPSRNSGNIKKCGILRITNPKTKSVECHGIILVEPIKAALSTIEQLDGTRLNGTTVDVRRYVHRTSERDRRDHFNSPNVLRTDDRRRGDRRRSGIRTERIYQIKKGNPSRLHH